MHTPPLIKVLSSIVEKSSKNLVRDFRELKSMRGAKETANAFVNQSKAQAESRIHELLHKTYPQANLFFKCAGLAQYSESPDMTWVINVLDGEENFKCGLPHFSMSFCLFESGRLTASLVFDPLKNDLFWAYKGTGAFCGVHRMRVHAYRKNGPIVMIPGSKPDDLSRVNTLPFLHRVKISWGSPALDFAYVACGYYDGLFFQDFALCNDIYAGLFMIKESGGFASNRQGRFPTEKQDIIIAGNNDCYNTLGRMIPDAFFDEK